MDQKLLLSFQYASNVAGLAVPWDEIGRVMGEGITGSAVIQHLAKTRTRMIARGLAVPPPLRRGGGTSRILATGTATATTTAATPNKSNLKAKPSAKSAPRKAIHHLMTPTPTKIGKMMTLTLSMESLLLSVRRPPRAQ